MKRIWSTVVVSIVAAAVGLSAQANPSTQQATADKVTVSGCIQNAPPAQADQPSAAAKFVLADAKPAGDSAVGTAGSAAKTAARYQLAGDDKTISPHLNHRVEITGTLQSGAPSAGASSMQTPTLKVESVKMVAAKCS
jgi:hypothetical protein